MEKELTQADILPPKKIKKETHTKNSTAKKVEESIRKDKEVPSGFIEVSFSSKDKLCPSILHFRDYSLNELMEIVSANEDNQLRIIVKVLSAMCFEHYDCSLMHPESIKEIMLSIYANFWGATLLQRPFYIDTELADIDDKKNIGYTDIDISNLHLIDITDNFKVPFRIISKDGSKQVKFGLTKMEHIFKAERYVREKYAESDQKYRHIASVLKIKDALEEKGEYEKIADLNFTQEELDDFEEYSNKKDVLKLKILQSQLIEEFNGEPLESLEDQLNLYESGDIDKDFWLTYNTTIDNVKFGLDPDYTFKYQGKEITRRFSFRLTDLLPSVDKKRDTGYIVQFDD